MEHSVSGATRPQNRWDEHDEIRALSVAEAEVSEEDASLFHNETRLRDAVDSCVQRGVLLLKNMSVAL